MFPKHFFEETCGVLSSINREISAEKNQMLSENTCALLFNAKVYYVCSRTDLVINCRSVSYGYILGGEVELRNLYDGLQILITSTAGTGTIYVTVFDLMDAIAKFDDKSLKVFSWY